MVQNNTSQPTHIAYADESTYNIGRYRGLGLVTVTHSQGERLTTDLHQLLRESNVQEVKWQKLDSAQMRFAALKFLSLAVGKALDGMLRVDVLTWDIEDSRHKIRSRDDTANLHRMYYHLLKNVLCNRWPHGSIWRFHPDENSCIDWGAVETFVGGAGIQIEIQGNLFDQSGFELKLKEEFRIEQILPRSSHEEPLIQLADLFVGLGVYSRAAHDAYERWHRLHSQQKSLFDEEERAGFSRADRERCFVLCEFDRLCKRHKMRVSLKTYRGLRTLAPDKPINFWPYEPQHARDKAPTR